MNLVKTQKNRNIFLITSTILIILSIFSFLFIKPKISIDFSGGTLMQLEFTESPDKDKIRILVEESDFITSSQIQFSQEKTVLIKTNNLDQENVSKLNSKLNEEVGEYKQIKLETIGPSVSSETTKKAIMAIIIASIAIILYIAYAFRSIPKPASSWRFGLTAIITLLHDLIISIGVFVALGYFFNFEIDSLFIVAILTILGYSVNDTIVIFDRIRENLKSDPSNNFENNVNLSLNQSLTRSLNTSLTLIVVLLSLLFLGGESIQPFVTLLLIGSIIGTYSSLFIAPPLLIVWENKIQKSKETK